MPHVDARPMSGRPISSPGATVLHVTPMSFTAGAVAYRRTSAGLEFNIDEDESLYLGQTGNPQSLREPQRLFPLALSTNDKLKIEVLRADSSVANVGKLFVLLCNRSGNILERPKVGLEERQSIVIALRPEMQRACFAVRLAGTGTFKSVLIRTTLIGQDRHATSDYLLEPAARLREVRVVSPAAATEHWLHIVPAAIRASVAAEIMQGQDEAMSSLRRGGPQPQGRGVLESIELRPNGFVEKFKRFFAAGQLKQSETVSKETITVPPPNALIHSAMSRFRSKGVGAALGHVLKAAPTKRDQLQALEELATRVERIDPKAGLIIQWIAYGWDPRPPRARKIALRMFKGGNISSAFELLKHAPKGPITNFEAELITAARISQQPPSIPARAPSKKKLGGYIAYVASSALPYTNAGYTVRTHNLLAGMKAIGLEPKCFARPGYPWDRPDALTAQTPQEHAATDGIDYFFTPVKGIQFLEKPFVDQLSEALFARFSKDPPALVHAASNHRNALPALIAARRIGVPFIYEIRGLWELTAASRNPIWEHTERFALERQIELRIAHEADHVLTITEGLRHEIGKSGIPLDKISLLPNAVAPETFQPREKDPKLVRDFGLERFDLTLVYTGSITNYEGLDDVVHAIEILRAQNLAVKLIIVGEGQFRSELEKIVSALQVDANVSFVGRVTPQDVPRYTSLADVIVLPRKNYKVCRIVSPLKPFEAMALAKPVVLSDLPVSREIVEDGVTGLLCPPENPESLAAILKRLSLDPELRSHLGASARKWILDHRTWGSNATTLRNIYDILLASRHKTPRSEIIR